MVEEEKQSLEEKSQEVTRKENDNMQVLRVMAAIAMFALVIGVLDIVPSPTEMGVGILYSIAYICVKEVADLTHAAIYEVGKIFVKILEILVTGLVQVAEKFLHAVAHILLELVLEFVDIFTRET